jgi:hypothetical protein
MAEAKISDSEVISNWRALLKVFDGIDPKDSKAKEKWGKLAETANHTNLAPRQRSGIVARCNHAINGQYKFEPNKQPQ